MPRLFPALMILILALLPDSRLRGGIGRYCRQDVKRRGRQPPRDYSSMHECILPACHFTLNARFSLLLFKY